MQNRVGVLRVRYGFVDVLHFSDVTYLLTFFKALSGRIRHASFPRRPGKRDHPGHLPDRACASHRKSYVLRRAPRVCARPDRDAAWDFDIVT